MVGFIRCGCSIFELPMCAGRGEHASWQESGGAAGQSSRQQTTQARAQHRSTTATQRTGGVGVDVPVPHVRGCVLAHVAVGHQALQSAEVGDMLDPQTRIRLDTRTHTGTSRPLAGPTALWARRMMEGAARQPARAASEAARLHAGHDDPGKSLHRPISRCDESDRRHQLVSPCVGTWRRSLQRRPGSC